MKKIVNSKKIKNLEVWSDNGWVDIKNIHTTIPYIIYILRTDNFELHCADNHIIFDKDFNEIFVKDIKMGDYIQTENGLEIVLEIFNTNIESTMYDLEINSDEHRYFTNGILSHNTSICKILAENTDFRKIKATERGVDTIEVIEEHCKNFSLPLRRGNKGNRTGQKIVWLEEFDQTTPDFRKALRSLMEDEKYLSVRFIATANNVVKLQRTEEEKALIGRFNLINFDPETKDEVNYLKDKYLGYLSAISKNVKLELNDEILNKIINRTFPNLRKAVQLIQEIHITGDFESYLKQTESLNSDVYSFILNTENVISENYFFVMDNYPKEKTEDLLVLLSRTFFKHLINEHPEIVLKNGFKILKHMKEYNAEYTSTSDPETHLVSFITELKELVKI